MKIRMNSIGKKLFRGRLCDKLDIIGSTSVISLILLTIILAASIKMGTDPFSSSTGVFLLWVYAK